MKEHLMNKQANRSLYNANNKQSSQASATASNVIEGEQQLTNANKKVVVSITTTEEKAKENILSKILFGFKLLCLV